MTEHDVWDEGSELSELRELHRQDRMPADVRERLIRQVRAPNSRAHAVGVDGVDGVDVSLPQQARPSWPALPSETRGSALGQRQRTGFRRIAYGLGASALMAAAVALIVGGLGSHFGVGPDRVTLDLEAPGGRAHESSGNGKPSGDPNQAELRVVGWLIPNSLTRLPAASPDPRAACRHGFQLSPLTTASNAVLRVEYAQCRLPDAMVSGNGCVKITADGYVGDDGHLEASRVLAEGVHCQP